jgi:hypothetical protein
MRTLTLKLTAAITGRKPKPPIPDADLAAIKERARTLLNQQTEAGVNADADALGWHDLYNTQPAAPRPRPPVVPPIDDLGLKNTPRPTYDPERSRVQAMSKVEPFGTSPTRDKRPGPALIPPYAAPWAVAWARLTPAEQAWSSQP